MDPGQSTSKAAAPMSITRSRRPSSGLAEVQPSENAANVVRRCKFFVKGKCKRGAQCSFAHGKLESQASQSGAGKKKLCIDLYRNGSCPWGEDCRFAHSTEDIINSKNRTLSQKPETCEQGPTSELESPQLRQHQPMMTSPSTRSKQQDERVQDQQRRQQPMQPSPSSTSPSWRKQRDVSGGVPASDMDPLQPNQHQPVLPLPPPLPFPVGLKRQGMAPSHADEEARFEPQPKMPLQPGLVDQTQALPRSEQQQLLQPQSPKQLLQQEQQLLSPPRQQQQQQQQHHPMVTPLDLQPKPQTHQAHSPQSEEPFEQQIEVQPRLCAQIGEPCGHPHQCGGLDDTIMSEVRHLRSMVLTMQAQVEMLTNMRAMRAKVDRRAFIGDNVSTDVGTSQDSESSSLLTGHRPAYTETASGSEWAPSIVQELACAASEEDEAAEEKEGATFAEDVEDVEEDVEEEEQEEEDEEAEEAVPARLLVTRTFLTLSPESPLASPRRRACSLPPARAARRR